MRTGVRSSIDQHIHSYYSDDGEFSPEELVAQCKAAGIVRMSICDHDCARANGEGAAFAKEAGIDYVPGIEISCVYEGVNLHVLGLGICSDSGDFLALEENILRQQGKQSRLMLQKTRELGFAVDPAELEALIPQNKRKDCWTGELFAEVLLHKPCYAHHPLLLPYRPGGKRSDNPYVNFYWDYYAQGKPCYAPIQYPDLTEAAAVIHRNGGKAVLAHPGASLSGRGELLFPILDQGLDGIEAHSSYHTREQVAYYEQVARERGLTVSFGSDYHGKTKPSVKLGMCMKPTD